MFRRVLVLILFLSLFCTSSMADPLELRESLANDIVLRYDEADPSAGSFEYSYRYPQVDENAEGGSAINSFYMNTAEYLESFTIPMDQTSYWGDDYRVVIDYTVTCNNDEYFSVLIRKERKSDVRADVYWEGQVFSREHSDPESTFTLPKLLGILESGETDEWLQERQKSKSNEAVYELVWDMIRDIRDDLSVYPDYTREFLSEDFHPEQDYYLDENGEPVFYLNPGVIAPESIGLITFSLTREDILDEM